MGKTQSKQADNNGEIINNVNIEDTVSVESKQILFLLVLIIVIKAVQFLYVLYKDHKRGLKKKYLQSPAVLHV